MSTQTEPLPVFNKIKTELRAVQVAIKTNSSILLRQEQIDSLNIWKDLRYSLLYHDKTAFEYDNSANLLENELKKEQHHLRTNGFDLSDYQQELKTFVDTFLKPLRSHVEGILNSLEKEIEDSNEKEPKKPPYFEIDVPGLEKDDYYKRLLNTYEYQYPPWEREHVERLFYREAMRSLQSDLDYIEKTINQVAPPNDSLQPVSPTSTPLAIDEQKQTLIEWFAMPGKYPVVMGLLVEKGLCQPGTRLLAELCQD